MTRHSENFIDPPLTEKDAEALHVFYEQFLRKGGHDALALLKSIALVRRNDLREFVHNFALMRKRLDTMLREARHRELLLSFPSTIRRVHELVWEGQETYGADGSTAMTIVRSQATDYLDETEMFRIDLDSLLADCPAMLPNDREGLARSIKSGYGVYLFLLVALADHLFVTLLPHDHPQPTEAVLRIRTYLQGRFGEKFEDQIIEFFVLGGGYIRVAGDRAVLCGVHPLFDPVIVDFGRPETDRLLGEFVRGKFQLALAALRAELPDEHFAVQL